jgi:hypothetical protein
MADAGERCPEVAIDVMGERLERGDVEHPAALVAFRKRFGKQAVKCPEERSKSLT